MLDIISGLQDWTQKGKRIALATVTKTWGSAPRKVGAALAISEDMEMLGSVSGGCVEGAVVKEAMEVLNTGVPKSLSFGVTDENAWEVGLSCGGEVHVFLEPFLTEQSEGNLLWEEIQRCISENEGCVWISKMGGVKSFSSVVQPESKLLGSAIDHSVQSLALEAYGQRKSGIIQKEDQNYFAHVFPRKSQLLIIGAAHITVDLVDLAQQFGFECIVIDPRGIFSEKTQFRVPPDQLFVDWPAEVLPNFTLDAYSYAVLLTHDPKIDDQALHILMDSNVAYIGALGGRKTHKKRVNRLQEAGVEEEKIARIHGPIGMDINAQTAQEIALSILGELIQAKNQFL
ncbi:MAG: XdhC family protein [Bacteroidota bacterium]